MEFTLAKIVVVEEVVVEALCGLVGLYVDEGWIVPTTQSMGVFAGGLVGSVLGQGELGFKSYKVSD